MSSRVHFNELTRCFSIEAKPGQHFTFVDLQTSGIKFRQTVIIQTKKSHEMLNSDFYETSCTYRLHK